MWNGMYRGGRNEAEEEQDCFHYECGRRNRRNWRRIVSRRVCFVHWVAPFVHELYIYMYTFAIVDNCIW
jgi:hypothetical protein